MAGNEIVLLKQFVEHADAEAFSEIVRRTLKDESRAADVVQETFLRLLHDGDRITDSLAGWLHRIATHKSIDAARRDRRRRKREAVYAAGKLRETHDWQHVSGYVDEAMEELDEHTRELLIKHFLEGRRQTDIAADGGMSQATVSRRIESGVSELGKKLHSRGVLVVAGALGPLLLQNAVEAAPAVVLQELGKMALVGASAVGASGGASAAASGVLAGIKAKIVTVAAVAAVGVGGVVSYKQVTRPAEQPKPSARVATPVAGTRPKATALPMRTEQPARTSPAATIVIPQRTIANTDTPIPDEPAKETISTEVPRLGYGGYGGGDNSRLYGYGGSATPSAEQEETGTIEESNEPLTSRY